MWTLFLAAIMSSCIAPPSHCLPIDTVWGDGPTEPFLTEDWLNASDRWDLQGFFGELDPVMTTLEGDFGNQLVLSSEAAADPDNDLHGSFIERNFASDMTGRQVAFRVDPFRMTGDLARVQFLPPFTDAAPDISWFAEAQYGDGFSYLFLEIWDGNDNTNVTLDPYEPDGAHAWWRFWHSAETGQAGIDTSPVCGNWTNRVTRSVTGDPFHITPRATFKGIPDGTTPTRASATLSQLWACAYPEAGGS